MSWSRGGGSSTNGTRTASPPITPSEDPASGGGSAPEAGWNLFSIDLPSVSHPIQENLVTLDIVSNPVVTQPQAPLSDFCSTKFLPLIGILLQPFQGSKQSPMGLGVELAEIFPEPGRDDEAIA